MQRKALTKRIFKFEPQELELAKDLVEKFSSKSLDLSEYSDTYAKELRSLVEAKSKGKKIAIKPEHRPEKIPDLLEAFKASMQVKEPKRS